MIDCNAVSQSLQLLFARWSRSGSYPAFAWLCILALPLVLNLLAGINTEFRASLGEYYGLISLFLMFQFSLGFACLFLTTMLVTSVGRSELIDQLRLTATGPAELLGSLLLQLIRLIGPPTLAFFMMVAIWMFLQTDQQLVLRMVSLERTLVFLVLLVLAQFGTMLTVLLGIGRNVFVFVICALVIQFLLTGGVIYLLVARILPWWLLPLIVLGLVAMLRGLAIYNLTRLWPPQSAIRQFSR